MKIKFFAPRRDCLIPNFMVYLNYIERQIISINADKVDLPEDLYVYLLIQYALEHQSSIFSLEEG